MLQGILQAAGCSSQGLLRQQPGSQLHNAGQISPIVDAEVLVVLEVIEVRGQFHRFMLSRDLIDPHSLPQLFTYTRQRSSDEDRPFLSAKVVMDSILQVIIPY